MSHIKDDKTWEKYINKKIKDYFGAPKKLKELEKMISFEINNSTSWVFLLRVYVFCFNSELLINTSFLLFFIKPAAMSSQQWTWLMVLIVCSGETLDKNWINYGDLDEPGTSNFTNNTTKT